MKDLIYTFIRDHLASHAVWIALSVAALLGAMAVDFACGVKKARARGEATTSQGPFIGQPMVA